MQPRRRVAPWPETGGSVVVKSPPMLLPGTTLHFPPQHFVLGWQILRARLPCHYRRSPRVFGAVDGTERAPEVVKLKGGRQSMMRGVKSRTAAGNKRLFQKSGGMFRAEGSCRRCWLHRTLGCTGQRWKAGQRGKTSTRLRAGEKIVSADSAGGGRSRHCAWAIQTCDSSIANDHHFSSHHLDSLLPAV